MSLLEIMLNRMSVEPFSERMKYAFHAPFRIEEVFRLWPTINAKAAARKVRLPVCAAAKK